MIQLPQRSVTRFFIPLIDVLTLLFCIFLVMPLADQSEPEALAKERDRPSLTLQARTAIPSEPEALAKDKTLQKRLAVRVLEIDGDSGKLYYHDPERILLPDEAAARALLESDRRKLGQKELYYLILYPRNRGSPYPTVAQREQYDRWFEGVALGYDVPGAAQGGLQP